MKTRLLLGLVFFLVAGLSPTFAQKAQHQLSGYVKEKGSRESLAGANIYITELKTGTTSNTYGFYSIRLPEGDYEVRVSYVGYKTLVLPLSLYRATELDFSLEQSATLGEVVVTDEAIVARQAEEVLMSKVELNAAQIQNTPTLLGEKDLLKTLQLLPGVQSGGEGQSGIYVRGGGPDQNLILVDEATVYNASHLFGFFSLFNGDAIKSVTLTKGGFPARYGGRLSSVVDITMKEGDQSRYKSEVGIGLLSSRAVIEGPILKNKASFIVSARRTYIDVLTRPIIKASSGVDLGYYFYDLNAKLNYEINRKNRVYLSSYFGRDKFLGGFSDADVKTSSTLGWGNATGTLRWNHQYSDKVFFNTALILSDFSFRIADEFASSNYEYALAYSSQVRDLSLKFDADLGFWTKHRVRTGIQITRHVFTPSAVVVRDSDFPAGNVDRAQRENNLESGIYIEDQWRISDRLEANIGMRFSHFTSGSRQYFRPEPRLNARYLLNENQSIKFAFSQMNQYLHLLSNSGIGLPTDLWLPANDRVKPQRSTQIAAGYAHDLPKYGLTFSVETYYKISRDVLAYRPGASFVIEGIDALLDPEGVDEFNWEDQVTTGQSESYGIEFLLQKPKGKFNGWIGYTLAKIDMTFPELNFGRTFPARYDRRHDISVVAFMDVRKPTETKNGVKLNAVFVFGTGNAITIPQSRYQAPVFNSGGTSFNFNQNPNSFLNQVSVEDYGPLNSYRMANYHRMDIGIQFTKPQKWGDRTWELGIYNVYNRYNPWIITSNFSGSGLVQYSLFGIVPSITYSFKFR